MLMIINTCKMIISKLIIKSTTQNLMINTYLIFDGEWVTNNGDTKGSHTCRILKTSYVKEVTVLAKPAEKGKEGKEGEHQSSIPQTLPAINPTLIKNREQRAIRRAHVDAARIGVGVSQEAQDIFNSLCKTYVCLSFLFFFFSSFFSFIIITYILCD